VQALLLVLTQSNALPAPAHRRAQQEPGGPLRLRPAPRLLAKVGVLPDPSDVGVESLNELIGAVLEPQWIIKEDEVQLHEFFRDGFVVMLVEACGPALDLAIFSSAAAGVAPAGLLAGIAALSAASTAGNKTDAMQDDLQALVTAVAPVAGNSGITLVAAPGQAAAIALRLLNVPYALLSSVALPAGTVAAVVPRAVVSAIDGPPAIDSSVETELHRESQPGDIVDIGGITARPVASLYQTDAVGLRLRWPISFALRSSAGIAWIQNVNW
jgi:hypothetical protein